MKADAKPRQNLFHFTRLPRPVVDRAGGIYLWDKSGKRYIDGSSGAVNVNIGHGNRAVIDAMKRQMDRVSFAYTIHFENEPANELARELAERLPEGLERIYFVSGGSEAVEAAIKLARQWAVATGQEKRWKVIGRMPSYHGITIGALEPTGDDVLTKVFAPMSRPMPLIPAPFSASRPRQSLAGGTRAALRRHAGGEDPGGGRRQRARLHHGADRRRRDRSARAARQLFCAHPRDLRPARHPAHP